MLEKDLIAKSKGGDSASFEELIALYRDKIFQHTLGIVKNEEAAKDLTQETFFQAYKHLPEFRGSSSFYTWVYRISHNLSLNYLKKKKRHPEEELREDLFKAAISHDVEENEMKESVQEAVKLLSDKHRKIYEMCEIEKLPQRQVAKLLKIPEGTVRSRLYWARKKVGNYLRKL